MGCFVFHYSHYDVKCFTWPSRNIFQCQNYGRHKHNGEAWPRTAPSRSSELSTHKRYEEPGQRLSLENCVEIQPFLFLLCLSRRQMHRIGKSRERGPLSTPCVLQSPDSVTDTWQVQRPDILNRGTAVAICIKCLLSLHVHFATLKEVDPLKVPTHHVTPGKAGCKSYGNSHVGEHSGQRRRLVDCPHRDSFHPARWAVAQSCWRPHRKLPKGCMSD